ncbi:MAG: DNA replication/repair protein RecF [Clostridia bacterium]|nr:DNA replication/repair protein RecF [Clostridia bacterium]
MHIEKLKLINFRNYEKIDIKFGNNFNIIFGENAQGKTNILEAIFLCASGRSHRTSKDTDLIRINESGFLIKVEYKKQSMESQIEVLYEKEQKKRIKINEIPIKKIGNLIGNLNAIIFSPEDLMIIKEGPSERRRFIDITLSQLRPSYFYDLQQYAKVLHQRNILLKDIQKNRNLIDTLEVWNMNMAIIGTKIMKVRHEFIKKLNKYIEESHRRLAGGQESLKIKYSPSIAIKDFDEKDIKEEFTNTLKKNINKEILKQSTLYGPQRDDYEIRLNDMSLKLYGSQGQQRTAVLSIKLAEMEIMKEEIGEYPVLLLDDVMSELDNNRQEYLMENMRHIQTFITCTDSEFFKKRDKTEYTFFNIKKGEVTEIKKSIEENN